jgi:enoyl-CoA hydratase/carnithine racemase
MFAMALPNPTMVPTPVTVIRLDRLTVNSLGHALRQKIHSAVAAAQADATVRALLLIGSEKAISAGADVREFGQLAQTAFLLEAAASHAAPSRTLGNAPASLATGCWKFIPASWPRPPMARHCNSFTPAIARANEWLQLPA